MKLTQLNRAAKTGVKISQPGPDLRRQQRKLCTVSFLNQSPVCSKLTRSLVNIPLKF